MLAMLAIWAVAAIQEPPRAKTPPSREELAAITARGRDLAGYDAAAWHASDALQAKGPKEGTVGRYIARKTDKGWTVAFGRLDESGESFLVAYEATQGDKPDVFVVEEKSPATKDVDFFLRAARAIDVAHKDFADDDHERRPYNVAVLPADEGRWWVYVVPAPTRAGVGSLGGEVRYLVTADGSTIAAERRLHNAVSIGKPEGVHSHVLDETPEDTDVFHVLTRRPSTPELIVGRDFVFQIDVDGAARFLGKAEDFLNK
ncbi:hypothetical protein [Planctomyces sp. SH-PL62]|uniref:hypothetical protein n=1 Tax=Planctomyces sp. SH-PL62 TaxID=1636152 RepID=UPI00078EA90B|nr:hypothetical protein [Planctomyces sp. SH-PL62]AMV40556.1 hypothetical protein VT85_24210 [Planctomyces sp. SH-PL62]